MPRRRRKSRRSYGSSRRRYTGSRRRSTRSGGRSRQRIEIVVRSEGTQQVAGVPPMVVDGGRLKMVGDGPKTAKF